MKVLVILLVLVGFTSSVFAFEPAYTNYFSNPEFKIYKTQESAYEFSIPYKISNAEIDNIDIDCESTEIIVYFDKVGKNGNFVINMPRDLLDMKINDKDDDFIVIIDQLETEYKETDTEIDSRTLNIPLRANSKVLEIIATNVGMFPEPIPCGVVSGESPYYRLLSPLKQIQSGIPVEEIQCKQNLVLIQKYDGTPACVTESTKTKLIERGWTTKDSSAQEIIERLKQNTQPVNEVDARYIETLALMNQTVSNFVHGVDWTSQCCGYSENDGSYQITITFLDLENQKQLGVTFDAETMKITDIQHSGAVNIGKGLSSEPDPYRLVALREFPDESAYYHKINSLSEIPYLPEINENKTTIITSEQFNDLLEWFPQKCLENNSDSYNCSNTPPIFEYNSVKYLIVSHELDSTEVYCESGLLYVVNYEKEFPDRKLDDFVPAKC